jgi:PhoPQ-activated pathogenicity-related protein
MVRAPWVRYCLALGWVLVLASYSPAQDDKSVRPLDAYIAKPDPAYTWKVVRTVRNAGVTTFVVDLKSQTWLTEKEVDRTLWQHWLVINKPDNVKFDTAFVMIGGGKNGGEPPEGASTEIGTIAKATQSVVAELRMIPNQPLVFHNDGVKRSEDDLIGYAWDQFLKTGNAEWLPRLPMAKSVVRAMDTITALLGSGEGGKVTVDKFVVAGGSKRGWTTWITGAADKRVVAIVPIVIDVVNVKKSMEHHFSVYGFWAPAVGDYVHHKITDRMDSKEHQDLLNVEDPYTYLDRLTMPKYIVNGSGDQFFVPDSSQFYFDDLKGPKFLRYVPNADHSLRGSDALMSITAFYQAILKKTPFPKFSWTMNDDGSITVKTETKPRDVTLWQANNPKARDFRLESIGPAYTKSKLEPSKDGTYHASVETPAEGWTAFFVELTFDSGEVFPFKFTTQVSVVPDKLPHSIDEYRATLKNE